MEFCCTANQYSEYKSWGLLFQIFWDFKNYDCKYFKYFYIPLTVARPLAARWIRQSWNLTIWEVIRRLANNFRILLFEYICKWYGCI